VVYEPVTALLRDGADFRLVTPAGDYLARAVIFAAGASYNRLGVPGEEEFAGKGVSWCATCDAAFFAGQDVAVVGGGDAALDEGIYVTRYARTVHLIHRRDTLRGGRILQERVLAHPKFVFHWDSVVERISGSSQVESLDLRNVKTGEASQLPVSGLFVFVGQTPNNGLLRGLLELDAGGHAPVDLRMRTSVPGLFVAGDLRTDAARQLVAACGDGATAALSAEHYLASRSGS